MGFLRGIMRRLGSNSIVGKLGSSSTVENLGSRYIVRNLGPKLKFTSFGTVSGKPIYLEDVKLSGTMEQKKACLKDLVGGIIWRMSNGIEGGCMDPKKIRVIDNRIRFPDEEFILGKHPSYFVSLKDLVIQVHKNDHMSLRERLKFEDFKIYLGRLSRVRHLKLLHGHPHLHTAVQEIRFIPSALNQLQYIPDNPHAKFPNRHFPLPRNDDHQVGIAMAIKDPKLYKWQTAYRMVCVKRPVNIGKSIENSSKEFREMHEYRSGPEYRGYQDDPADELRYFRNVMKHIHKQYPEKQKRPTPPETTASLFNIFPTMDTELFQFFWCYDGHARGTIDIERIQSSRSIFQREDL